MSTISSPYGKSNVYLGLNGAEYFMGQIDEVSDGSVCASSPLLNRYNKIFLSRYKYGTLLSM